MPDKSFEHVVPFRQAAGNSLWLPVVTVSLLQRDGRKANLPLLFDTGASYIVLHRELHHLLGVASWDSGERVSLAVVGGRTVGYRYRARFEFLGKAIECRLVLAEIPRNPLYVGLFGREEVFGEFGFGFWERARELYVTLRP